jgi:dipeptidyl aminopeptidase/acylaminoacyl peptidase
VLANTLQLVHELIQADKPVDMMIYPEGVHVLEGQNATHQLKTMIAYFVEHLKPEHWQQTLEEIWAN